MRGRERRGVARLLGVQQITHDGLLLTREGTYVRYLQTGAINPLVMDAEEAHRSAAALLSVAGRIPAGQSLQLQMDASPLDLEQTLAEHASACAQAAAASQADGRAGNAEALRLLGRAGEQSITLTAAGVRPVRLRHTVICPWRPAAARAFGRERTGAEAPGRAIRDCERHAEGIAGELESMGLSVTTLDGSEVLDLLAERFDPARLGRGEPPASFLHPDALSAAASSSRPDQAQAIATAICRRRIDLRDPSLIRVGECAERLSYVALSPEQTWLGWLLHLTQSPLPFTLTVHVHATDRHRERLAQKRRYKRIFGVNRGIEQRGRPLDPDARLAESEAAELTEELTRTAGAGIYRLGVYLALRDPGGDAELLAEVAQSAGRELTTATDARLQHGRFAQRTLWSSTLPLGRDPARRTRRYASRNVGDSFPLLGTGCGSPAGIALGYALPGRTLERLDPFDPAHPNHLLLVNGMSGAGKTMSAILLLCRAIAQGASGFIIDRAGHFDFLVALIPDACSVQVGGEAHAINAWDVPDPACVAAEKVDYMLALHALLLGEHHAARDSYGLSDLESNLLGLAIVEVYERCALTGEEPRELLLQEELERRYEAERSGGALGIAEALRNLSMRLSNYLREGPYGYLTDRPTTIPADSPLIAFDTRTIPEAKAPAALFVICEHVKSRIEAIRREHLAGEGPAHPWAGRSFLVIDEAWKLIERPATGRWFNEFCRRSRHYALWLIAISQQLSDFDNEHGRALLANAAMRLFLRQDARELAYVRDSLGLSGEAVQAIAELRTVRGQYSTAFLMNGTRGQGTIQIATGPLEYWLASSDPARDEPLRREALRDAGGRAWRALELLADEEWQLAAHETLRSAG